MAQSYKTAIEFGLVYIPISLHACVKSHDIGFNMLYKKTKERIKYRKTCENCPANISSDDIVKGYEYQPGKYVTLSDEELEKIKSPKDKSIAIVEFVRQSEIDPIFYDRAFYAAPKGADKAFLLLLKALEEEKMVAIAKTVLGTKEQLVCLRAENGKMILSTLHFSDEIQEAPALKSSQLSKTELDLAKNLIKNMASHFQPEKFKDEYREKVIKAIETKISGEKITAAKKPRAPKNVISLMDALKQSVAETKKSKKA